MDNFLILPNAHESYVDIGYQHKNRAPDGHQLVNKKSAKNGFFVITYFVMTYKEKIKFIVFEVLIVAPDIL